jgi:hypothetical protein
MKGSDDVLTKKLKENIRQLKALDAARKKLKEAMGQLQALLAEECGDGTSISSIPVYSLARDAIISYSCEDCLQILQATELRPRDIIEVMKYYGFDYFFWHADWRELLQKLAAAVIIFEAGYKEPDYWQI